LVIDYYPEFANLSDSHKSNAEKFECSGIRRSAELIYPSSWAADSAIRDYGADPLKVHVVPFGANIDRPELADQRSDDRPCRLLFIGTHWIRKGGDIALEALQELERLGVSAELTIVGSAPPGGFSHPRVKVVPFINKNEPAGRAYLDELFRSSDFFLLPSRAECFSIALCEANAYGLPVLSTRTGGLPELVREGINGFLFSLDARGEEFAVRIRDVFRQPSFYKALRASSREEYESRLNWDAWGKKVKPILSAALGATAKPSALSLPV
jgi:glycosyltransferase involved in cell wall biosynthesis